MGAKDLPQEGMINLITELLAAWNAHDIEYTVGFYALDYQGVDVSQARPHQGPRGIRQMVTRYWQAFPDLHFRSEGVIVQGDRIALVWTARGSHQGKFMNIPPTGHQIQVWGVSWLTVVDGKIKEALYIWDVAGLLRNLGLLPDLYPP